MGIKALVDYALVKELCSKIKRDNSRLIGRLKSDRKHGSSEKRQEINKVKSILLSKRKKEIKNKKSKRRRKSREKTAGEGAGIKPSTGAQPGHGIEFSGSSTSGDSESESGGSDTGSATGSGSESDQSAVNGKGNN